MKDYSYIDINSGKSGGNIETLFPRWEGEKERVCVFSPHDDDAIIGAGYAIAAAMENGAQVYLYIFCKGNAGYSVESQKEAIVGIREKETRACYEKIGLSPENIIRFNYSDFSVLQSIGWNLNNGCEGSFKEVIGALRKHRITRLLVPNHYREHIDHLAVNLIGTYDAPQAGDPIVMDWGAPGTVESIIEYSVWADLSPEDALENNRNTKLRANRMIVVPEAVEHSVRAGILEYVSQGKIIDGLVRARQERLCGDGRYLEVYLAFDPRPKLDYLPYVELYKNII